MTKQELLQQIKNKRSFLCIGLDTDINKIPKFLLNSDDPVYEFNREIINKTHKFCIAYKLNFAFYECLGPKGWLSIEKTIAYLKEKFPEIFTIADAKRGDIGNTSKMYAKAVFELMNFDAITVVPYMGEDSVSPFLSYQNKWVIILTLTSNQGAYDFQTLILKDNQKLYEKVLMTSKKWADENKVMYVIGATKAEMLQDIRKFIPEHFLLVPGIGAQGGNLEDVVKYGINQQCGLIVNSSRDIIYAGSDKDFAEKAKEKAIELQKKMNDLLEL